jgi:hypothetical protein
VTVKQDSKEKWDPPVHTGPKETLELMVKTAETDKPETMDQLEKRESKVKREIKGSKEKMASLDQEELPVPKDQLVRTARRELTDAMEMTGSREDQDPSVVTDPQECPETGASTVCPGKMAKMEYLVPKVNLAIKDPRELRATLVYLGLEEKLVI